jgi:hypothetical protein
VEKLWPPVYSNADIDIGAYVMQFEFSGKENGTVKKTETYRLDKEVIESRLAA